MEDFKSNKNTITNIYEDASTFKLKKYKLILKKKELAKKFEISKIPISDNIQELYHWDIILIQTKLQALDFHEERKWKRSISYLLSHQCVAKYKKIKTKRNLDELYKRCMCLYISMNVNNNFFDISHGHDNKNMSERLNRYIKENSNIDFYEQSSHWRKSLNEIKEKLKKKFGSLVNAKHFTRVLELIENMIDIQENLKTQLTDNIIFSQKSDNILDLNILDKEMNEMLKELTNEIEDPEMFTVSKNIITPKSSLNEDDILININPKQLFYNSIDLPNEINEFSQFIDKNQEGKTEIIVRYDYNKMINGYIDKNKYMDDFEKSYYKAFPMIFYKEKSLDDKMLLESEIEVYKTRNDRILLDSELLRLHNLKFEKFTILQKLILLWGLINYGTNMNIISEIPNIFGFSKSLGYDHDEIMIYLDKLLENFNIDLIASDFELVSVIKKSSLHNIYQLDPPMLNCINYDFYYNKYLYDDIHKIQNDSYENKNFNVKKLEDISNGITLIKNNPIFMKNDTIKEYMSRIKIYIKTLCEKIEILHKESDIKKFPNIMLHCLSNETTKKEKVKLKKENIEHLQDNKFFNLHELSERTLDNTKPNLKHDILEGVAFYSTNSIAKEWEILRTPWYQNNIQFKTKFRKHNKNAMNQVLQVQNYNNYGNNNMNPQLFKNLSDNRNIHQ